MAILIGAITLCAVASPTPSDATTQSTSNEKYEAVGKVSVYGIPNKGWAISCECTIYRGTNTCDAYYLKDDTYYYPVRENKHKTFKNEDVSGYDYMCTIKNWTYFFNY